MNGLYISVGTALILALLAALIGPFFVDWGTYRTVFEREATKVVGVSVTVLGEVDARLLPSPRIRFGDVVVGPVEAPIARVGRFELDLEAAPLLKGDVRVAELRLDRPSLDLTIGADGRPVWPKRVAEALDPSAVAIDQIEIGDGRLSLVDARGGGRIDVTRISAVGSAQSLAGPWKLDGGGQRGARQIGFHLAGGRTADGATAVKLQLQPADDPAMVIADLALRDGGALTGRVVAERRGEASGGLSASLASWRAEAQIAGDARAIEATGLTLALGPEDRAAQLTGAARLVLGAEPGLEATLTARQVEIDRLASAEAGRPAVPAQVARDLVDLLAGAGEAPLPGRLRLEVQGLVVGGGAVQEVTVDAHTRAGGLALDRFEARLPGRSRMEASGRFAFDGGPRFDGRVEAASEQPASLAGWWRAEAVGDRLDAVSAAATVSAAPGRLRADDLRLDVARAKARGHLDWDTTGARVGLSAEKLELDQVSRLARLFLGADAARRPAALALDLDAGQMIVGGVTARDVAVGLRVAADDVAIERLAVRDLAGARLSGSGHIADPLGAPAGRLDLRVEALKPEGPARALATLAGSEPETVDRIASLAALAAPLDLTLKLEGRAADRATALTASLAGFAGGAELAAEGGFDGRVDDPTHAAIRLSARLAGAKAAAGLVRLFGGGAAAGPVALDASAEGRPADGLKIAVSTRVGATSAGFDGSATVTRDAPTRLDGRVRLATPDAAALGSLLGRPILAFERRLPVDLTALVAGAWPKLAIGEIAGRVDEVALRGAVKLDLGPRPVVIDGRLDLDRLDVEALGEAILGGALRSDGTDPSAHWATTPLLGAPFDVAGTLALAADRAVVGDAVFDRLRAKVVARAGELRFEGLEAGFAGGRFGGEISTRRSADGVASLSGRLSLDGAALGDVAWRRAGRAVVTGRLGGDVGFSTSGRSAAALVAGLGGEGRVKIGGAHVVGLGGDALAATRVALGESQPTPDLVARLFQARMDAAETDLPDTELAFALQAGVARSGRSVVETPNARITGRVGLDLTKGTIEAEGSMEPAGAAIAATQTAISKATPSVGLAYRGPIGAPERSLDVAPLVAHLTLGGIEREIERVEALQKDIAERARIAAERRRLEEMRAAEEAAKREAEARREAEAKREAEARRAAEDAARREAEAKRAAEEAAKRAAAQPKPAEPKPVETKPIEGKPAETKPAASAPIVVPPSNEAPPAAGTLPPLPPPVVIGPAPAVGDAASRPLTIVPPGVQTQ